MRRTWEEWAAGEGPAVLARSRQYPPTTLVSIDGVEYYVLGYPEDDSGSIGLWVTKTNPGIDYERAVAARILICPDHLITEGR